jgi:DNA-directed RNA polymerase specialized sigma24 family protein
MDQDASPGVQPVKAATQAEIIAAMESITDEDSERLEQVAVNRIIRIGRRAANGRSHEDLLQEAMERTLERRRIWYREQVEFVPFLVGVTWSIASEWAGHRERNPRSPEYAAVESQITREDDEGNLVSPFAELDDARPTVEETMIDTETAAERAALLDAIKEHFAEDENASLVLMAWEDGMDGPAIQKDFGFSETIYRSTVRRIKRNAKKIMEERHER